MSFTTNQVGLITINYKTQCTKNKPMKANGSVARFHLGNYHLQLDWYTSGRRHSFPIESNLELKQIRMRSIHPSYYKIERQDFTITKNTLVL